MSHTPERDRAYVEFAATLPTYFAYSVDLELVKIGFSSNVLQRLGTIKTDRPDAGRILLIGWRLGGPLVEAELHEMFSEYRERNEWFHPHASMAEYIDDEGCEGAPPVLSGGEFRITARGYWAARRRLAMVEMEERVVHDFGNGLAFRASMPVMTDAELRLDPALRDSAVAA